MENNTNKKISRNMFKYILTESNESKTNVSGIIPAILLQVPILMKIILIFETYHNSKNQFNFVDTH